MRSLAPEKLSRKTKEIFTETIPPSPAKKLQVSLSMIIVDSHIIGKKR